MDMGLGHFGKLNKPFYQEYITSDLGEMFEATGLEPYEKHVSSVTKTLSWQKVDDSGSADADETESMTQVASNIVSVPEPGFSVLPAEEIVAQVDDEESGSIEEAPEAVQKRKKLPRFTRLRRILPGGRKRKEIAAEDDTEVAEDDATDGIELTEKDYETDP